MHMISLVEKDVVAELEANAPDKLSAIRFHPSVDALSAELPCCVVVAAAEEKIAHNLTYEVTLTLDLHTQADDMSPDDAREFARELARHVGGEGFLPALQERALEWLPFYLRLKSFDAIEAEDRRYVHRVQLMVMAQG